MLKPSKTSQRVAAPFVLLAAGFSMLALHCSSDTDTPVGTAGAAVAAGSGGMLAQTAGSGGMVGTSGTPTTAGTPGFTAGSGGTATAGAPATTAGSGGATAGAGGATAGAGGATAGAGGSSGSGGGSGGATGSTFADVQSLLKMSCAGKTCHNMESKQADWITVEGLYDRLTKPIGDDVEHCKGKTPVVPGMPDQSLLLQIVKGKVTCNANENLPQMPDDCPKDRPCLTPAQIEVIRSWIAGGAKM